MKKIIILLVFLSSPSVTQAKGFEQLIVVYGKMVVEHLLEYTTIGPFMGGQADKDVSSDKTVGRYNYGLGFYYFKSPLTDIGKIKERLVKRAEKRLINEAKKLRRKPTKKDLERLENKIIADSKDEFHKMLTENSSAWPDPGFNFIMELTSAPSSDIGSELRLGMAFGITKFFIGPTLAAEFSDDFSMLIGGEISTGIYLRFISKSLLFNPFFRYESRFIDESPRANQIVAGGRFVYDLF